MVDSETDENNSGSSTSGDENISYALIHEASSLTGFDNLANSDSVESQIARGRGKGTVKDVDIPESKDGGENTKYTVSIEEGRLKVDSGYVVRFIDDEHRELNAFDVKSLDTLRDYPAPDKMIENLPPRIRGRLKEYGYVKIRGAYSAEQRRFYGVKLGWDSRDDLDPWDRIMSIVGQVGSISAAVDYVFVEEGPERWDVEEVAAVRGNKPQSVRGNVRAVRNELDN